MFHLEFNANLPDLCIVTTDFDFLKCLSNAEPEYRHSEIRNISYSSLPTLHAFLQIADNLETLMFDNDGTELFTDFLEAALKKCRNLRSLQILSKTRSHPLKYHQIRKIGDWLHGLTALSVCCELGFFSRINVPKLTTLFWQIPKRSKLCHPEALKKIKVMGNNILALGIDSGSIPNVAIAIEQLLMFCPNIKSLWINRIEGKRLLHMLHNLKSLTNLEYICSYVTARFLFMFKRFFLLVDSTVSKNVLHNNLTGFSQMKPL